jgi:hypothetical protein
VARDWSSEIETLVGQLTDYYIVPDVSAKVGVLLRAALNEGAFAGFTDEETFAKAVTEIMQSVNGDKHLYLAYRDLAIPPQADPVLHDAAEDPLIAELDGHGIARIERLPGNVGLLELRRFYDPAHSGAAVAAAMNVVAGTDVLLIDLRRNTGGEPECVALVCSYLVDARTQLSGPYFPADDRMVQFWTSTHRTGAIFGGTKPIFVLTSSSTFSGAEALSYDLQQAGRAIVVGERTAGGANFHYPCRVSDHLVSAVPSGYPVNPRSGTNWEGTGVQPDVGVAADRAFETAYRAALEHVIGLGATGARRAIAEQARRALDDLGNG